MEERMKEREGNRLQHQNAGCMEVYSQDRPNKSVHKSKTQDQKSGKRQDLKKRWRQPKTVEGSQRQVKRTEGNWKQWKATQARRKQQKGTQDSSRLNTSCKNIYLWHSGRTHNKQGIHGSVPAQSNTMKSWESRNLQTPSCVRQTGSLMSQEKLFSESKLKSWLRI